MANTLKLAGPQFHIRPATKEDVPGLTDVFFHSFNAPFWQYFMPDNANNRKWWSEGWTISLENPTDRNFVVEDTQANNRIVAFSRWIVPQDDGNKERKWPDSPMEPQDEEHQEVGGAFFGGMEENRAELMGNRPHWCTWTYRFAGLG